MGSAEVIWNWLTNLACASSMQRPGGAAEVEVRLESLCRQLFQKRILKPKARQKLNVEDAPDETSAQPAANDIDLASLRLLIPLFTTPATRSTRLQLLAQSDGDGRWSV